MNTLNRRVWILGFGCLNLIIRTAVFNHPKGVFFFARTTKEVTLYVYFDKSTSENVFCTGRQIPVIKRN